MTQPPQDHSPPPGRAAADEPSPTRRPSPAPALGRLLALADRHRLWIALVIAIAYLAAYTGQWRPTPDSALHLQIARNLVRGDGFTHPSGHEASVTPGLAWLVAASMRLTGDENLWPAHLAMLAVAGVTLLATYRLLLRYAGRPAAVLLTALLALTETFFRYGYFLLTDLPFLMGAVICLLGIERLRPADPLAGDSSDALPDAPRDRREPSRWVSLALVAGGIAIMAAFRNVVLTFLAPVVLVLVWVAWRSPHRWRYIAGVVLILLSFAAMRAADPVTPFWSLASDERILVSLLIDQFPRTVTRLVTHNLPRLVTESGAEAAFGVDGGPIPALIVSLGLGAGLALLARRRPLWVAIVAAFVAQWLIFIVTTRYFLAILPLLLVAWWELIRWVGDRLDRPWNDRTAIVLLALWLIPNAILVARFVGDQHHLTGLTAREDERIAMLRELATVIADLPADAVVLSPEISSHELTYLADRYVRALPQVPSIADEPGPWYVVEPLTPPVQQWLDAQHVRLGAPIYDRARRYKDQHWSLRPVAPAP